MGRQSSNERQRKAFTGLSHAAFDHLWSVFRAVYTEHQQQKYADGVVSGTRLRHPGGGAQGQLPPRADTLLVGLYDYKTYPPFDVCGTQCDMVRSQAPANLDTVSPVLHTTLVRVEMLPQREYKTPEEFRPALQGADRLIIKATERAYRRSPDAAKHREHSSGKKTRIR